MNCIHEYIDIYPTLETSWCVNDRYIIQCANCKEILENAVDIDSVCNYVLIKLCKVNSGTKYLPQYITKTLI